MQGLTNTQMLEENIALLEARIRELEDPAEAATSVKLHNPLSLVSASELEPLSAPSGQLRMSCGPIFFKDRRFLPPFFLSICPHRCFAILRVVCSPNAIF